MRKSVPLAVAGGVLVASSGVFGITQAMAKDVRLIVDGVPLDVKTSSANVGQLLKAQKITLGEHDLVAPAATEKLQDGQQISVRYGRPIKLTLDGQSSTVWTTAVNVNDAMNELALRDGSKVSVSRSTPIGRQGIDLTVQAAKAYLLVSGGESKQVVSTGANISEALTEAGVPVDNDDEVIPAREAQLVEGATVTVSKHDVKETSKVVEMPFKTVRKETSALPKGQERVDVAGVKGRIVEVWQEKFVDGKSVENVLANRRVEAEPKDEVVLVGTGPGSASGAEASAKTRSAAPQAGAPAGDAKAAAGGSPAVGDSCSASMYDEPQNTATGEVFNPGAMTAAHKTLPLNSYVKVTNPRNGKTVTVRINDRGPYVAGRCLDLSKAAFAAIGDLGSGVMTVVYQPL